MVTLGGAGAAGVMTGGGGDDNTGCGAFGAVDALDDAQALANTTIVASWNAIWLERRAAAEAMES